MGLNLRKLGQSIYHGLNPLDNGQGWTSAPVGPSQNQQAVAQNLQGARFGVLANPQAQQQFVQGIAPSHFNPVTAGAGAVYNYAKNIPAGVVNTVQVPYSTARLGVANVTGNVAAANQARQAIASDAQNNVFSPDVPFLKSVAATALNPVSNIYANREANRATAELTPAYKALYATHGLPEKLGANQASIEADLAKQGFRQDQLRRAGLNQNDSAARTALKIGAQAGQLAANTVMQAQIGNALAEGAGLGELNNRPNPGYTSPAPVETVKPKVSLSTNKALAAAEPYVKNAVSNGGLMAGSNLLSTAQQDNQTAGDYLKSGVQGFAQGALLSAGSELGGAVAGKALRNIKQTGTSLATPEMRVNVADQNVLRDYADMLSGANPAKGKELSDLIGQTQQIGQKYGVDLTNGSKVDRLNRAAGILDQIGQKNRELTAAGSIQNPLYHGDSFEAQLQAAKDKLAQLDNINAETEKLANRLDRVSKQYKAGSQPTSLQLDLLKSVDQHLAAPDAEIAKAIGAKQTAALKPPNLNADMFSKENIAKYEKMNAQDLAAQSLPKTPVSEAPIKTATGKANEPYPANPIAPIKLPDVKNATEAIRVSESAASDFSQRVDLLAKQEDALVGKNLDARDKFIQAVENPRQASQIAKTFGGDSQTFLSLVKQHQDLANMEHAAQVGASNPRAYFGGEHGYFSHDVVFNNPADKAAYEALMTRTTKGRTALERTNPTLADLRANKLDIVPDSLGNATRKWGARQATILRDAALHDRLQSIDPNIQVVQAPGENPHFISSNSEFNKQLKGVQPYTTPTALKPINAINTGLKQVGLFGGGFHDLKTSIRSVTTDIASARNPVSRLVEANKQFLSDSEHTKWNQARLDEGYGKLFADADVAKNNMGLDLRSSIGKDLTRGSVEKLNPYMTRLFGNKIDYFKKQLVIDEAKRNGITPDNYDPNNAAQVKIIRDAGDQAKNWFGGLNQRTLGKSPMFQQVLKYVTLAPDFTEGKIRSVGNVFTGGEKGSLARRQVISEAVGVAILAEAASKATTGQFTNPVSAVLSPSISTNMKDKKGRPLAIGLPGSTVADINRLVTDPGHFAIAHAAAGPSTLISATTGKDYFGDPLVDPFKNSNPNFGQNLVAALKSKGTIPGVQLSKTLSGKQSVATGIINTLGGRVGLDKNAPSYKETQAYFKAHDTFVKSLNPNDKSLLGVVEPVKKDTAGNSVTSTTFLNKPADFAQLQAHPDFLNKYTQYQRSQASHDPLWDLNPNQLNDYINVQKIKGTLPGTGSQFNNTDKAYLSSVEGSDWYRQLTANRTTYFGKLVASGAIPKGTSTPDALTQASPDVQKVLDQIGTPGINTSYLLGSNPAAEQYLSTHADELNQRRADLGLPPLPKFPSPPSDSIRQKDLAYSQLPSGTGARSSYLKSNPDYMAYWQQKQDYYTALDGSSASTSSTYSTSQSNKTSGSSYTSRSSGSRSSGRTRYPDLSSPYGYTTINPTTNPYKYSLSSSAGGSAPKAKAAMKVGNLMKKSKVATVAGAKPKVSIKRSLV